MWLLLCKHCSLQVQVLGLHDLAYGISVTMQEPAEKQYFIRCEFSLLCYQLQLFCFPWVPTYLSFSYGQKITCFHRLQLACSWQQEVPLLLRVTLILSQPASHYPHPFTARLNIWLNFLSSSLFCSLPLFCSLLNGYTVLEIPQKKEYGREKLSES